MSIREQAIEAAAKVMADVTGEPRVGRFERTMTEAVINTYQLTMERLAAEDLGGDS